MRGCSTNLKFQPAPHKPSNQRRRRRNVIWFNPPFNRNVQTNIRRVFINLINTCFPLDGHNKAILKKSYTHEQDQTTRMYNCCNQNDCPLKGECLQREIIYQATVTTGEKLRCMQALQPQRDLNLYRSAQITFQGDGGRTVDKLSKFDSHLVRRLQPQIANLEISSSNLSPPDARWNHITKVVLQVQTITLME